MTLPADNKPDPRALSEEEWFAIDRPLADLRSHYLDARLTDTRREHSFWRYWSGWIKATGSEPVSRATLEEILANKERSIPANEVVLLAMQGRISVRDAQWIRDSLPPGSWAHDQILAFLLVAEPTSERLETLRRLLALRADWAVLPILHSLPPDSLVPAAEIIQESARPKSTRRLLLEALRRLHSNEPK